MSSKYPILKPREIIAALESFGFAYKSQKGSHVKYIVVLIEKRFRIYGDIFRLSRQTTQVG